MSLRIQQIERLRPKQRQDDYALIRLEKPIYRNQYSKLLFDHKFDLNKAEVEVAGYPGKFFNYQSKGYINKLQAFTHTDKLNKQKDALLFYNADTSAGQSGLPVYYRQNNTKYVVGIHIYGNDTNKGNQGIRLSERHRIKFINWMKEMYVPKLSMYNLDKNGLKELSENIRSNEGEETLITSWHEKNAIRMDATIINNTNSTAWELPLSTQKYSEINNETLKNKSDINEEISIFAVTCMHFQPVQVQHYKAIITNITDTIVIGLITQKKQNLFIDQKRPISGFKDYLLAYMNIQDQLFGSGRIYYSGSIYRKYKTTDQSFFTRKGDQIEFGVDFVYKRVFLIIDGQEKLIQPIPKQFQSQSFYIYVFLGRGNDSLQIIKLGETSIGI